VGGNDPDLLAAPRIDDDQKPAQGIEAHRRKAFLAVGTGVRRRQCQIVKKDQGCVGEVNAVLLEVRSGLVCVPLEAHSKEYMYRRTYKQVEGFCSKRAMPQLTRAATYHGLAARSRRWAYHANVMNTFEQMSSSAACRRTGTGRLLSTTRV
jgi:hypothetical protein